MHERLLQYISSHSQTPLSRDDEALIREAFVPKHLRKRQYFLQESEVCKYTGFIISGALRQYTVDDKGIEHIAQLSLENWWVGDRESFTMLTPSIYNIDAWEDTDLLIITKADVTRLGTIPAITETFRILDEHHAFALQKRITAAISMSAEQRYADLINRYPQFLQRFPQHLIASYLGITKETLSRVRRRSMHK